MTSQNIGYTTVQEKPRIDLAEVLKKVKLDHLARSMRPDTYPEADRQRNLFLIDRISLMIDAFLAIRNEPEMDNKTPWLSGL